MAIMDPTQTSHLELLHAARRGDEEAARVLWASYSPRLLALARELLFTPAAPDVVQGVFVNLFKMSGDKADAVRDLAAYLVIATRNASLNINRSAAREMGKLLGALRLRREMDEPVSSSTYQPLHGALARLDDASREIILLKHVGGLTFDQVAICLSESRGTVVSWYQRALDTLREELVRSDGTSRDVRGGRAPPHAACETQQHPPARVSQEAQPR